MFKHPPRLGFPAFDDEPEPNQLVVKLDPSTGVELVVDARRPIARTAAPIDARHGVRREGGEGATPYEVLLHAAHGRREHALHAPGRRRGDLADHAAAARRAAAGAPVRAGIVGPGRQREARRRATAAGTSPGWRHDDGHRTPSHTPQSAAAPSPFPPIADYAFLSNCHTGALVAPDGAIDWLCVPSFDSPSVFGSLLDRRGRLLPVRPVRDQPPDRARRTSRERTCSVTTWKTPTGWIVVRDALTMGPVGPRGRRSRRTPGRRRTTTPTTCWSARWSASRRSVGGRARLRAGVRLRPRRRRSGRCVDDGRHAADATRRRADDPPRSPTSRWASRATASARGTCSQPGDRAYCALSWAEGFAAPENVDEAQARLDGHDALLARTG